jgi:hypothetical protein
MSKQELKNGLFLKKIEIIKQQQKLQKLSPPPTEPVFLLETLK